jgi:hypothetical protein
MMGATKRNQVAGIAVLDVIVPVIYDRGEPMTPRLLANWIAGKGCRSQFPPSLSAIEPAAIGAGNGSVGAW